MRCHPENSPQMDPRRLPGTEVGHKKPEERASKKIRGPRKSHVDRWQYWNLIEMNIILIQSYVNLPIQVCSLGLSFVFWWSYWCDLFDYLSISVAINVVRTKTVIRLVNCGVRRYPRCYHHDELFVIHPLHSTTGLCFVNNDNGIRLYDAF